MRFFALSFAPARLRGLFCILIPATLAAAGCSEAESAQARRGPTTAPVDVVVAPVRVDSIQRQVEVVGTLFGDEETTVSAKVSGRVIAVHRDVGDRVRPGEPLAKIETTDYELARDQKQLAMRESLSKLGLSQFPEGDLDADSIPTVRKAQLAADNAEGRFLRGKQLHDQTPPRLSDQEFSDLQTTFEVAKNEHQVQVLLAQTTLAEARARRAELAMAEQQLADATIRAPVDQSTASTQPVHDREYAVAERIISVGEFVRDGAPTFRLIDDDPIKLRASVPERFAGEVKVGQVVRIAIEGASEPFEGRITRINPQIDPTNRNFRIEALFENPQRKLKPGAFARSAIETRVEPNVIFVPQSSVVTFAGVHRIFVDQNGATAERVVTLGERRADEIEVRTGLKPEDRIVVTGAQKLVPGTPLSIKPPDQLR